MDVRNRFSRKFDVKSELDRAISYHQNGQLRPAERIYRSILEFHPRNAEVLHLLGLLAWQTDRCEVAINLIRQASQIKPNKMLFLRDLARFLNRFFAPPQKNTVYSSTGAEKYRVQYYPDTENTPFTIYYSKSEKSQTLFEVLYKTI